MNKNNIKRMTTIAVMSALSCVLYIVGPKFNVPIFPSFLDIHFSMLPILILCFMNGWIDGLIAVTVRCLIKLPFGSTSGIGELSDFVIGAVVVLSCGLFNHIFKERKYKNAILFVVGVLSWIIGAAISNSFSLPFYIHLAGKEGILGACSMIPGITSENLVSRYYLFAVIPFNFLLGSATMLVTIIVHKRLKGIYDKI